jgi:hypothetical protein
MRPLAVAAFPTGLALVGFLLLIFLVVGCSEDVTSDNTCTWMRDTSSVGLLAVFLPPILFGITRVVPVLRDHGIAAGATIVALMAAFWIPMYVGS